MDGLDILLPRHIYVKIVTKWSVQNRLTQRDKIFFELHSSFSLSLSSSYKIKYHIFIKLGINVCKVQQRSIKVNTYIKTLFLNKHHLSFRQV